MCDGDMCDDEMMSNSLLRAQNTEEYTYNSILSPNQIYTTTDRILRRKRCGRKHKNHLFDVLYI